MVSSSFLPIVTSLNEHTHIHIVSYVASHYIVTYIYLRVEINIVVVVPHHNSFQAPPPSIARSPSPLFGIRN